MSSKESSLIISNIEELFCAIETNFDDFDQISDQFICQIIKNPQLLNSFVTYTNIQLSNASTRGRGLILLDSLIKLCPTDILAEHSIAWINNALKPCQNEKQINLISFKIIGALLEFCSKTPELNKAIISNILEKITDAIKIIPNDSPNANVGLECLLLCLRIYAGSCGPRKIPLNKYLVSFLYLPFNHGNVRMAGKCMASLQQVGGGGVEGINYYNNWKKQQLSLISTVHALFDQFFEYVTEFGDYSQDILNVTPLEVVDQSESKCYKKITDKVANLIVFLQEMLLGSYPVKKAVLPGVILNVITRGLAITSSNLGTHVLEDSINLATHLCTIHKNLMQLLQCLILSLGTNLLPYGQTISKLIVNYIKNINNDEMFLVKTFRDLKLVAYETLRLWISIAKGNSSITSYLDGLLPILISDITPPKTELNLTVQNGGVKHMNKKARKKLMEQRSNNFANRNQTMGKFLMNNANYQKEICASALQTIQLIVNYEGSFMKVTHHKQLQDFVVKTLYDIQKGDLSFPYTNEACQLELYKTLIRLTTNHHYKIPPPINYTIILLTNGQGSSCKKISDVCSEGISNLNSLIHPYCATLQLPIDLDDLKNELKEIKKPQVEITMNEEVIEENQANTETLIQESIHVEINDKDPVSSEEEVEEVQIDDRSKNGDQVDEKTKNGDVDSNIVEIDESSSEIEIVEASSPKRGKFDEEEIDEEQMESVRVETEDDKMEDDVNEICSTFVDIVNE